MNGVTAGPRGALALFLLLASPLACANAGQIQAAMLYNEGNCLSTLHETTAATAKYDEYLSKMSEASSEGSVGRLNAELLVAMRMSADLGQHQEALRRVRAAIARFTGSNTDVAGAYKELALIEMLAGNPEAARAAYGRFLENQGTSVLEGASSAMMLLVPNGAVINNMLQAARESGDLQLRLVLGDIEGLRRDLEPRPSLNVMSSKILFKAEVIAGQRDRAVAVLERAAEGSAYAAEAILAVPGTSGSVGDETLGISVEDHALWVATTEGWPEHSRELALWIAEHRKGLMFEAVEFASYLDDPKTVRTLAQIRRLRAERAKAFLAAYARTPPDPRVVCHDWPQNLSNHHELHRLEGTIHDSSDPAHPFKPASMYLPPPEGYPVGSAARFVAALRARLPKHGFIVSFVRFRSAPPQPLRNPAQDPAGVTKYVAFVVGPETLKVVDLGRADEIDRQVRSALSLTVGASAESGLPDAVTAAWGALYDLVWRPLAGALPGAEEVFVSSDGALDRIPFAALYDHTAGRWLYEGLSLTKVASARHLLTGASVTASRPGGRPLVIADPHLPPLPAGFDSPPLTQLKGALEEGRLVQRILPGNPVLLTDTEADEPRLLNAEAPEILHISGHGLVLPASGSGGRAPSGGRGMSLIEGSKPAPAADDTVALFSSGSSPIDPDERWMRSMLVMGLPNNPGTTWDGYATAYEIMSADLRGTKLVVLSACSTGVGESVDHQGVTSLQRAFLNAGAESVLAALWPVNDKSVVVWMEAFYQAIQHSHSRSEAVSAAMTATRKAHPSPYHWAPFVLMGSTAGLDLHLQ